MLCSGRALSVLSAGTLPSPGVKAWKSNRGMYKPLQDLCLYSVIVLNVGNDSYSLGYCIIDCTSEMQMHFIDHLVPLDFQVPAYVNSIYCLSTWPQLLSALCECPWVVCVFDWTYIVCEEEHHALVFLAELWQKLWEALPKNPSCAMAELWSTAELFSLGNAKFQYFDLLWIGAVVVLHTKKTQFFVSICSI